MPVAPEDDDTRSLAELQQALAITTERPGPGGRQWCPPRTGEYLTRQMLTLGPALPGLAERAVRLARLLEPLGRREGYVGALYRLPTQSPTAFADLLHRGQPRLAGLAAFDGRNLALTEAAMAPARPAGGEWEGGPAFALPLGVLPLVAGWLDMAHNMLGYATVAALLDPVTRPAPGDCQPGAAHATAEALRMAVDRWLRPRLDSQHAQRQATEIRRFLSRQERIRSGSGAVDDDSILAFWCEMAPQPKPSVDGFRTFPSVARLMLAYRRAARLAAIEATHPGYDHGEPEDSRDPFDTADEALSHDSFTSPLIALATEPAARVTKARILEAVREAKGSKAADWIAGLKKPEMAAAAEELLAGTGWLPELLLTKAVAADEVPEIEVVDADDPPVEASPDDGVAQSAPGGGDWGACLHALPRAGNARPGHASCTQVNQTLPCTPLSELQQ
jgi:hypothetical protein